MTQGRHRALIVALLLVTMILLIWLALSWPVSSSFKEAVREAKEIQAEALGAGQVHGENIKAHKTATQKKAGGIREKKEAEIRTLSPDDLVQRHLDALARFRGESGDPESTQRLDGD